MELLLLTDKHEAQKVTTFLTGSNAFHWPLSTGERKSIRERVTNSLKKGELTKYWYYKDNLSEVIGAGALEKLPDTRDGYFLGWFAIHKEYRNQGLGRKIIEKVEEHARAQKGRFITIDTGEDNQAQIFYEKVGYKRVGFIPEYFEDKVGKIIYYKKL